MSQTYNEWYDEHNLSWGEHLPPPKIFVSRHAPNREWAEKFSVIRFDLIIPSLYFEDRTSLPPASLIYGNLPIPIVEHLCSLGHHYHHLIIPNRGNWPNPMTAKYIAEAGGYFQQYTIAKTAIAKTKEA